jgi:hypothetical protein
MPGSDKISFALTRQEALVLFEYLHRCHKAENYSFADQAEQRVLWNLECDLESQLDKPFAQNYRELLEAAWTELRDKV